MKQKIIYGQYSILDKYDTQIDNYLNNNNINQLTIKTKKDAFMIIQDYIGYINQHYYDKRQEFDVSINDVINDFSDTLLNKI